MSVLACDVTADTIHNSTRIIRNVLANYEFDGGTAQQFELSNEFTQDYANRDPDFGYNGLGAVTYYRTYSRIKENGKKERFWEMAKRVVNGTFEIQRRHCHRFHLPWDRMRAQDSAQEMFERMWAFKFLPPGRGLWVMGTPFMWRAGGAGLNNCFAHETEFITREGIKRLGDCVNTTQKILTSGGKWVDAKIKSFGEQPLTKVVLRRGRWRKTIYATPDHRWFVHSKSRKFATVGAADDSKNACTRECTTDELKDGLRLSMNFGQGINNTNLRPSAFGVAHGICFGDGTTGSDNESHGTYLYLCKPKDEQLERFFLASHRTEAPERGEHGAIRVADLPRAFRRSPDLNESMTYLYGFLCGYFAADGDVTDKGTVRISSSERENLELVRSICAILGIGVFEISQGLQTIKKDGQVKKFVGYRLTLMAEHLNSEFFLIDEHRVRFENRIQSSRKKVPTHQSWYVDSVESTCRTEEVFCPQVPETYCFTLAGNILTGNCGFVSTNDNFHEDPAQPFAFAMDMLMLGVGIGFDTKGADYVMIRKPVNRTTRYIVDDSREGWVLALTDLIHSYTINPELGRFEFDFSEIRPAGTPIKGFGGEASGPAELEKLLNRASDFFGNLVGRRMNSVDITDMMNMVGKCVVAGNVRRSAEIAFGFPDDIEYRSMKNPTRDLTPEEIGQFYEVTGKLYAENRYVATFDDFANTTIALEKRQRCIDVWNACNDRRWASNNSVFADVGMDYTDVGQQTAANGEPGYIWLNNMRDYGRMIDGRQPGIDGRVMGANPCVEQNLESYELCCLAESFPSKHDDEDDYMRTIKYAYMYAKTVTLLPTHNDRTNRVMLRNRRIGLSQSGIVQGFEKFGRRRYLQNFCDAAYSEIRRWDNIYSEWLACRESIKVTSVKPSGTVSLLAGVAPGIHFPEARSYWRRMRLNKSHSLVRILAEAGYHIEPSFTDPDNTVVVKFGVEDEGVRPVEDVSVWEQMDNVVALQHYWADNAVSVTIKFAPHEAKDIPKILEHYEDRIKAVSFLPKTNHGYVQAPYEAADRQEVRDYNAGLRPIDMSQLLEEGVGEKYCDSDKCVLN